ncbi:MAG: response regulator [Planctomycetota bacterium]
MIREELLQQEALPVPALGLALRELRALLVEAAGEGAEARAWLTRLEELLAGVEGGRLPASPRVYDLALTALDLAELVLGGGVAPAADAAALGAALSGLLEGPSVQAPRPAGPRASRLDERFQRVAAERGARLVAAVLALEEGGGAAPDPDALREVQRELHTLKGEAGVLGRDDVRARLHRLEDLVGAVQSGALAPERAVFDVVLAGLDEVQLLARGQAPDPAERQALDAALDRLLAGHGAATHAGLEAPGAEAPGPRREAMAAPAAQHAGRTRALRVTPERLEALSERLGDLLVLDERGAERARELEGLLVALQRRHGRTPELARLTALTEGALDDAFTGRRALRALSEDLERLRLGPVQELLEGYRRAAREMARAVDKDVALEIAASAVEVDQSVLEALSDPLVHLVRNAISHGIEAPAARAAAGKPRRGRVQLSVRAAGSTVEVEVEDDGAGIDLERVAARARARGALGEGEELSLERALELIFQPGFSTADLDELSGRGVGLDVVRASVEAHQGSLEVETRPGQGSVFRVRVPLNVAMAQALIVEAAGSRFALPVDAVEHVVALDAEQVVRREQGAALRLGEDPDARVLPLYALGALFAGEDPTPHPEAPVVLLRARGRSYALAVDRALGQRGVAYRPLGDALRGLRTVQASCALPSGDVALLLQPAGLLEELEAGLATPSDAPQPPGTDSHRRRAVLVVEDSALTRELVAEIARDAGYRVQTAGDGEEAWARLEEGAFDLLLTDLEMPRLDGLGLLERVRAHARLKRLPAIVITTRSSPEERRACLAAGADGFLSKSEFREGELLAAMRRVLG